MNLLRRRWRWRSHAEVAEPEDVIVIDDDPRYYSYGKRRTLDNDQYGLPSHIKIEVDGQWTSSSPRPRPETSAWNPAWEDDALLFMPTSYPVHEREETVLRHHLDEQYTLTITKKKEKPL
jgi:hypothetical protein